MQLLLLLQRGLAQWVIASMFHCLLRVHVSMRKRLAEEYLSMVHT